MKNISKCRLFHLCQTFLSGFCKVNQFDGFSDYNMQIVVFEISQGEMDVVLKLYIFDPILAELKCV